MRRLAVLLVNLCLVFLLASCGGGGGDGGDGGGRRGPALVFTPSTLAANFPAGSSTTLTVHARAFDPSIFSGTVYVYVVDTAQVLAQTINLSPVDANTFAATLYTAVNLAPGRHQGSFLIQLCRDSACAAQYPGSPVPLPYDFTVTNAPLRAVPVRPTAATAYRGGGVAQPVGVNVSASTAWAVSSSAAWLGLSATTGTGNGAFAVNYIPQALAVGSYTATVTVLASDNQRVDLPFSLEVLPNQFTLTTGGPSFSMVNGSTLASQDLGFAMANEVATPWAATTTAPWLVATPLSGTTPSTVSLRPDPTRGALASGAYAADLVLSSIGVVDRNVTTQLTLIPPTLSASVQAVTLGGPLGRDLTGAQSLSLSLNTGGTGWPWQLSGLPAWLTSSDTSGQINEAGSTLSFAPDPARTPAGSVSSTVTVSAAVNGDTVTRPITFNLNADQRRLLPSQWGVGFASTPTGAVLSRILHITDNFAGTLAWTAVSDSAWLSVTSGGTTSGTSTLSLTANAASLPAGVMSYATVTVSTTTPNVEPAVIRVGLWKDTAGLPAMTTLERSYWRIAADPIRPYVYAHDGGTSIDVFNAYSAQQIATIPGVAPSLGMMSVSPDGSRLHALDLTNHTVVVVDLASQTRLGSWPSAGIAVSDSTSLLALRPNGVELVVVGNGTSYVNGQPLRNTVISPGYPGGFLAATGDGRRVFTHNYGVGPSTAASFQLDYSAIAGGSLMATSLRNRNNINGISYGQDLAVSPDGNTLLLAGNASPCVRIDPVSLSFISTLPDSTVHSKNVEITSDGRLLCSAARFFGTYDDVWLYAPNGSLLRSFRFAASEGRGVLGSQLVATPDGLVVIAATDDPRLIFLPIGPP